MTGYAIVPDIDAPELTATDIAVWVALCRHAQWEREDGKPVRSKEGTCFPSLTGIQKAAHCARSTVCEALKKLERLGYVVRKAGNTCDNTEYTLFPDGREGSPIAGPSSPGDGPGGSDSRTRVVRQPDGGSPVAGPHIYRVLTEPYNRTREQEEEGNAAADNATLSQVVKLWNTQLGPLGFPEVMKETPSRRRAFQARVTEAPERRTLAWWRELIARIGRAEFLRESARGKAGWLNFDWILNENNLVKVLEGRYDGKRAEPSYEDRPRLGMSMEEYLRYLQKDPFFGGPGKEEMSYERREHDRDDGVGRLPEGGGGPLWAALTEQGSGQGLCLTAEGF